MRLKRTTVDGIPNIRLTRSTKDRLVVEIANYVDDKYPAPDSSSVLKWLEKVGNEAYPEAHRQILRLYDLGIEHHVDIALSFDNIGKTVASYGGWGTSELAFSIRLFDMHTEYQRRDSHLIRFINRKIREDTSGSISNYVYSCLEWRKTKEQVKNAWLQELWWADYTQQLSADLQTAVKDIICKISIEEREAIDRFRKVAK